jgi:hypothetical protein
MPRTRTADRTISTSAAATILNANDLPNDANSALDALVAKNRLKTLAGGIS